VIEHVLNEDETIYINEDGWYPFWVNIHQSAGYVKFKTHTKFRKSSSLMQRLELCNALNLKNYLVTAGMMDDQLMLDHVLIYRDGLLRENFIRACRQFARNCQRGIETVDPENDVVLQPGSTESEDHQAS